MGSAGGFRGVSAALLLLVAQGSSPVRAQGDADKPRVSVRVEPRRAAIGQAVTIDGVVPLDAVGAARQTMTLRVTKPDGAVIALDVVPAPNGDYVTGFTDTLLAGEYVVDASSPGGAAKGRGTFEIEVLEPLDEVEAAVAELGAIATAIERITADVETRMERLPDTAARDTVRAKWGVTRPRLERAVRDLGDLDELLTPFREAARNPKTAAAVKPVAAVLRDWTRSALPERTRIVQQLDASRKGNAQCEAAEHIIEGINFAAALANLMGGPINAVKSVVVDFVASQLGDAAAKLSEKFKFPVTEATKIASAFSEARLRGVLAGEKMLVAATAKKAVLDNALSLALDFSAMVAQLWFNQYCERLAGSWNGSMHAEFLTHRGDLWWEYDIEFAGRLELRYAKGDADGPLITRVNGEFLGQAIHFKMKEEAVRLGFPELSAGMITLRRTVLPQPEILNLLTLTPTLSNGRPVEPKPIDIEGKVAATLVKPYTFYVPVEGEIVNGVLTLRRKPATKDYEAASRTLYVGASPLFPLHLLPIVFELPFKNGEFFLTRAMGDDVPFRVDVKKTPKALMVDHTVNRDRGTEQAHAKYRLSMKLCNPEGKC